MPLGSRPNLSQQSDEVLLQLVAQRNLAAYDLLYRRHAQVMYNLITRIVRDPGAGEAPGRLLADLGECQPVPGQRRGLSMDDAGGAQSGIGSTATTACAPADGER